MRLHQIAREHPRDFVFVVEGDVDQEQPLVNHLSAFEHFLPERVAERDAPRRVGVADH